MLVASILNCNEFQIMYFPVSGRKHGIKKGVHYQLELLQAIKIDSDVSFLYVQICLENTF